MAKILPNKRLIDISKAPKNIITHWKFGVLIESDSGRPISHLTYLVAADRWYLAYEYKRHANRLLKLRPALYRSAISRYYYSMYHAMRACSYVFHGGDDYERHNDLPSHIPLDFPPSPKGNWQNTLKDARETRNRADYDPYPKSDKAWKPDAMSLKSNADKLLLVSRNYLRSKGCTL